MSFDRDRVRAAAGIHVGDSRVPGFVVLVASGDDVYVEAFGNLTVGGPPVQRDSLFRIASTTKPITAAATLAVIDEGLVGLDEPVDRLLPELAGRRVLKRMDGPLDDTVPAERSITTRDLLTFTFGFGMVPEMFGASRPWPVVAASDELRLSTIGPGLPDVQPEPDTWIAGLGSLPLLAQPGERWMYNTGASVLGVLLARATGQPFGDVLRTRLFEPLGMRDTALWTSEVDRLATAYRATPDGLVVWDEPDGQWSRPPAFGDGAAGIVSTAEDLFAFSRMLLAGGAGVLPTAGVREMTARPAHRRSEVFRWTRPNVLREHVVGLLPGGVRRWRVRLERRLRDLLGGRSFARPDDHRDVAAHVRQPGVADGAPRDPRGRVREPRPGGLTGHSKGRARRV